MFFIILQAMYLVRAITLDFHQDLASNTTTILHKYSMYSIGDVYGYTLPLISANCKLYTGTSSSPLKVYIGILTSPEMYSLPLHSLSLNCSYNFSSIPNLVPFSSNFLERKISSTEMYNLLVVSCDTSTHLSLTATSINPYGHLEGEYIYLIPVIPT